MLRNSFLGVLGCLCFGCPGVEPTETGTSSGGEGGRSSTASSTGKGPGSGSTATSASTGMGGGGGSGGCDANLNADIYNCGECGRVCLDDDQVAMPVCKDGVCRSFCESGFVNITQPGTGPDDGCEAPGRRAFVTEQSMTVPQIGGIAGADLQCQTLADLHLLGGEWRAWLSDVTTNTSVAQRFTTVPVAPYMLLDATPIADSFEQLTTDLALAHAIDLTENLTLLLGGAIVWTGTTPAGLASGADCGGWMQNDGEVTVGSAAEVTAEWTELPMGGACNQMAHLYCFEQ